MRRIIGLIFLSSAIVTVHCFTTKQVNHVTTSASIISTRANHKMRPRFELANPQQQQRPNSSYSRLSIASTSLISSTDTWGNLATLTGNAAIAQQLGTKTKIGKLLGGPVTAMAITFLLASIGILSPGGTVASKSLQLLSLQLATPLILLGADLRDCISRCGPLLLSFVVASISTIIACIIGWSLSGNMLTKALGKTDGLIIAAALMAKNIGGGINYIAVCKSLSASPNAIAAGLCIDNIFALIYFPITNALASDKSDIETSPSSSSAATVTTNVATEASHPSSVSIQSVSTVLFLSSMLLWLGEILGTKIFKIGSLPCCTLLTVLFASWSPKRFLTSSIQNTSEILGTSCLYLFFATAGAPGIAVADSVRAALLPLTIFLTSLYSIHGIILWLGYRFWGRNLEKKTTKLASAFLPQRLLIASSAAIGGPATSVALAQANDWKSLMVPSLLVGNIGYAIATFCALAYYAILK